MRILLTGANGQLGSEVRQRADTNRHELISLTHEELDIADREPVMEKMSLLRPDCVINAAAYTHVDGAQTHKDEAYRVNTVGPENLALGCEKQGAFLIHISTDFVFDGQKQTPYRETDPTCPVNVYGKTKEEGEKRVSALSRHLIVRTSWLYGIHGKNFFRTMLFYGREKEVVRVVSDQYGCPTCAADLADAVLEIAGKVEKKQDVKWGIYHYCGSGVTSWYGFAEEIFRAGREKGFALTAKLEPTVTENYPTPAKRPSYSALDCSRIANEFNIMSVPWQKSLEKTLDRLKRE